MIYLYLSKILPFLFKSIILSTFFFLQINSNLYAGVISYKANFEVSYAGDPSDVFPYGYPEAAKCRIIPLEINISISNDLSILTNEEECKNEEVLIKETNINPTINPKKAAPKTLATGIASGPISSPASHVSVIKRS